MKVSRAIKMLAKYHDMDEHIMIDWICQESYNDVSDIIWEDACLLSDDCEYIVDREMGGVLIDEANYDYKETLRKKAVEASNKRTDISGEYNTEWKPITKEVKDV